MDTSRERGFTLIEILVTVAIIAVLASLVIGVASKLSKSGEEVKSVSNLKQIVTAMHSYANDNGDYFPRGYFYQPGQAEVSYVTELLPYLDEKPSPLKPARNIFISPTSALPVPVKPANAFIPLTYSVHGVLCSDTSNNDNRIKRSTVARPSQVILIGDSAQNPGSKNSLTTFKSPSAFYQKGSDQPLDKLITVDPDSDTSAGLGQLRYRANGYAVVAMVDGHVVKMKKGTVTYANVITDR